MLQSQLTGQVSSGINPIERVLPVLGVERIGSGTQEQASNAKNFILGQTYQATVQKQVDSKTFLVKVDQQLLKMQLGDGAKTGEAIALRYIKASPVPTFLLDQVTELAHDSTELSQTGKLIAKLLRQAQGAPTRYQAQEVVTQNPLLVAATAQSIKQSISKTGLFYESHLQSLVQGETTIDSLKQEPQNTQRQLVPNLVSQQLNLLESQKFAWTGEIWPSQVMQLDIAPVNHDDQRAEQQELTEDREEGVDSQMTLTLPELGKIKVKLRLQGGQLNIQMLAEEPKALVMMQGGKHHLQRSLMDHVETINRFSIMPLDTEEQPVSKQYRHVTPG